MSQNICETNISFNIRSMGIALANAVKTRQVTKCLTSITKESMWVMGEDRDNEL